MQQLMLKHIHQNTSVASKTKQASNHLHLQFKHHQIVQGLSTNSFCLHFYHAQCNATMLAIHSAAPAA
jgi:hypothetical protein